MERIRCLLIFSYASHLSITLQSKPVIKLDKMLKPVVMYVILYFLKKMNTKPTFNCYSNTCYNYVSLLLTRCSSLFTCEWVCLCVCRFLHCDCLRVLVFCVVACVCIFFTTKHVYACVCICVVICLKCNISLQINNQFIDWFSRCWL